MNEMGISEGIRHAAEGMRKRNPDERILLGFVPGQPTEKMVAAGVSMIRDTRIYPPASAAKQIWEAMWAASEDERTYRG